MDNIIYDVDQALAIRLRLERDRRHWSLADLARQSSVSKAMLSRIERREASPTAQTLVRIASAFNITLADLLTFAPIEDRYLPKDRQPLWTDPSTRYVRRQIFAGQGNPLELAEIVLPACKKVSFPSSSYTDRQHVIWVLEGNLAIDEVGVSHTLTAGDRLHLGPPGEVTYRNDCIEPCRYLVALLRTSVF